MAQVVYATFGALVGQHAGSMTYAILEWERVSFGLILVCWGVALMACWIAWRAFARGLPEALLGGFALLLLYSMLLTAMAAGLWSSASPEALAEEAFEMHMFLLALWMAATAGAMLALRVRHDEIAASNLPETGQEIMS